ncbi:MAG: 4-(cytidine 5'-diphospho)-2-C-methyl-D-erythritol kinase [Rhodobiaceae bacterium]|nr:4-(cytidine 5'-diphospho)-2-C-methyl-D-erythritol kinase [Rhodobiaceae bacterium]MCC0018823.1 4-(cytidine 5'-diphospho)-2-C-methyl-D-erythritol kinase [Rhodobiaceae bacterium]MCC0059880.1 4-(cytidine 5'-diphospho)-2-C-methyl-D-erythritol kinase [Rhodobiaceae bacterium]
MDAPLPPGALRTRACAKINLTLHVLGRRADGYHELESLVAFADCADTLTLHPGNVTVLDVRMNQGIPGPELTGPDNLVLKASRIAASRLGLPRAGRFLLDKELPVAAGIGGGSADAAAALRLILAANQAEIDENQLILAAMEVGADVPVCIECSASVVTGIGEHVTPIADFPELDAVLVNPRVPLTTAKVFAELGLEPAARLASPVLGYVSAGSVRGTIASGRNDLQAAAISVCPQVADCIAALEGAGATPARMSGSGATCFGLFDDETAARIAAERVAAANPDWWVRAVTLF